MNWLWADDILRRALMEDIGAGDITTALLPNPSVQVEGAFLVKEAGVVAGLEVALRCFELLDPGVVTAQVAEDGSTVEAGNQIAHVQGPANCLLTAERVALNLLQRMSGIATAAAKLAALAAPHGIRIVETRKTAPGLRLFDKYAVELGSGFSHRFDLSHSLMLKDNHFAVSGLPPAELVQLLRQTAGHSQTIAAEASSPEMAASIAGAGADIVMLDNFSPQQVREALALFGPGVSPLVEITGGITPENIGEYLIRGVDVISLGWLTHSVRSLDVSLEVMPMK